MHVFWSDNIWFPFKEHDHFIIRLPWGGDIIQMNQHLEYDL